MSLNLEITNRAKEFFPNLEIKYKDESLFMKILSKLMFYNNKFMTDYTTTIGSTVYYPSKEYLKISPISSAVVLLHELVHMYDSNKSNKFIFGFLYLFPQILALLFFPMLFISWKIAIFFLLFLLPIPAYFRMKYEKRAYLTSLYVIHVLSIKKNFAVMLEKQKDNYLQYFKNSDYYFMWIFGLKNEFEDSLNKINNGEKPFEDPEIFNILDKIIEDSIK